MLCFIKTTGIENVSELEVLFQLTYYPCFKFSSAKLEIPVFSWYVILFIAEFISSFFGCMACGTLVPQPGSNPMPPAVEMGSPNHWTAKAVPITKFLHGCFLENSSKTLTFQCQFPFLFFFLLSFNKVPSSPEARDQNLSYFCTFYYRIGKSLLY